MKTTRTYPAKCTNCNGEGFIQRQITTTAWSNKFKVCPACNGSGVVTVSEVTESKEPLPELRNELI